MNMAKIAEDVDFDNLKKLVDDHEGWILELEKSDTKVWTKPIVGCSFQMVKINTVFPDISNETLYDVLHDPDYRRVWDTHMLDQFDIGLLNVNNDVGYYASKCLFVTNTYLYA
jgi:StAR-related lipid transfer protein 10